MKNRDTLHVKTLGERFYVYFHDEEEIDKLFISPMHRNHSIKLLHLLAYLLYFHGEKVDQSKLLEVLYGSDYGEKAPNNLRALIFRLRKLLQRIGLPDREYVLNIGGAYKWDDQAIHIEIDAKLFKEQAEKAMLVENKEEQIELLKQVVLGYCGDFLGIFANEPWVIWESVVYHNLMRQIMERLCALLRETERYGEIVEVSSRLISIMPSEQWYVYQIQAYLALNQPDQAYRSYEYAIKKLVDGGGCKTSKALNDIFWDMDKKIDKSLETIQEIRELLNDDVTAGTVYFCSMPSFIDIYRIQSRITSRHKNSTFLILCTLTDAEGNMITNKTKLEKVSEQLRQALLTALRASDILTRYNMSQYLFLLCGIVREDCSIVTNRINRNFKKLNGSPNYFINYYIASVMDNPPLINMTEERMLYTEND